VNPGGDDMLSLQKKAGIDYSDPTTGKTAFQEATHRGYATIVEDLILVNS
jgi:hypothetical protein